MSIFKISPGRPTAESAVLSTVQSEFESQSGYSRDDCTESVNRFRVVDLEKGME